MTELRGAMTGPRVGKNGRLFLGSQDGFDLDRFVDCGTWNRPMLDRWRSTLARRGRELSERGIPYVFFIVPDAPSVYPEDLPNDVPAGFIPPGEVFLEAMGAIENVIFVYPLADLLQAKGGLDLYQKNDTHWTSYGSYVGYRSLMRAVEGLVPWRTCAGLELDLQGPAERLRRGLGDLSDREAATRRDDERPRRFAQDGAADRLGHVVAVNVVATIFAGAIEGERLVRQTGAQNVG